MAIDPTALASLIVSIATGLGGIAAYQQSKIAKTNSDLARTEAAGKAGKEVFDTARGLIEEMRIELAAAKRELAATKAELRKARVDLDQERASRKFLQARVHELELTVKKLENKLKSLGIVLEDDSRETL